MKEPIPLISAPGTLTFINILAIIFYFFEWNWISSGNYIFVLSIGLVILSPLLNLTFHPIWKYLRGYNSFGYQRLFKYQDSQEKFAINVIFDKYLYLLTETKISNNNKSKENLEIQIDFARRRVASYLMYYTTEKITLFFTLVGFILVILLLGIDISPNKLAIASLMQIINYLLFITFHNMRKDICNKLYILEKNILEYYYGDKVRDNMKKDIKNFLDQTQSRKND